MKILSIDGGGIRGIIPLLILEEIERRKQMPICRLFDLIVGTSTGGIIALFLSCPDRFGMPKHTASSIIDFYDDNRNLIFPTKDQGGAFVNLFKNALDPKYDSTGLRNVLHRYLGLSRMEKALTKTMVTTYDIYNAKPYFFKSFSKSKVWLMRDAAYATAAAPTYFPPHLLGKNFFDYEEICLVDGGIFVNNPAMCAYAEAQRKLKGDIDLLLSLGTGRPKKDPIPYYKAKDWGMAGWARPLIDSAINGSAVVVDYQLQGILSDKYIRMQPDLDRKLYLDDVSDSNIAYLKAEGRKQVEDNSQLIRRICELL